MAQTGRGTGSNVNGMGQNDTIHENQIDGGRGSGSGRGNERYDANGATRYTGTGTGTGTGNGGVMNGGMNDMEYDKNDYSRAADKRIDIGDGKSIQGTHKVYTGDSDVGTDKMHNHIGLIERELQMDLEQQQKWDDELKEFEIELQKLSASKKNLFGANKMPSAKDSRWFTYVLVAFASMGGLLSGLDQSLISGANLYMPDALHLDTNQVSWVNSLMPLGAVGGALLLGPSNENFGRKYSILIACILFTVGAALQAGAQNFGMMAAGRIIMGAGLGLEGGTVPVYVAECVASKYRGSLVSLYQFNIALGEVFGYAVAAMFVDVEGTWRWMLGSSLVFSTILLIGVIFLPESPRWLMHKGRELEAYTVWRKIRGFGKLEDKQEFFLMRHLVEQEEVEEKGKHAYAWVDFFTVPRARRAIIFATLMVFLGQFTGVNAIMYYMSVLLNSVGFDKKSSVFMSLVGGGSLLLGTIPAILYMDRFGRRTAAITLLPGFFIGLLIIGLGYLIPIETNLAAAQGVYLTGLILYMFFFGSYACLTWVVPSEVYPTYLRSYGMVTSAATLFTCAFLVTYFFADMMAAMGKIGLTLGFYGGIAVVGWFYQILYMPETKDKTLEEIDLVFSKPTPQLVRENIASSLVTTNHLLHFRFRKAFLGDENERDRGREQEYT